MEILSTIATILIALLLLCTMVVIHEAGHFWMGRLFGFRIDEFAVGFGPKIWSHEGKKGTLFSWRVFPVGGFCRFHGEDEEGKDDSASFNNQSAWKRVLVLLAGPAMNILFAIMLSVVYIGAFGLPMLEMDQVTMNSPAEKAGVEPGDIMVAINGKKAYSYRASNELAKASSAGVDLTILRDGVERNIYVSDIYDAEAGRNMMGVLLKQSDQKFSITAGQLIPTSVSYMWDTSTAMVKSLVSIFLHPSQIASQASGPIGTVQIIQEGIRSGLETSIFLAMIISLNLGLFNLLPIPALDGSRILFALIEIIFRRPVPRQVEGMIHFIGFAFLMFIMVWATVGDIGRLMGG